MEEGHHSTGCDISPGKAFETVQTEKVSSSWLSPPHPPRVPQNICLLHPSKPHSHVSLNSHGKLALGGLPSAEHAMG